MPDFYATILQTPPEVQQRLADAMELRAADPLQREILQHYLGEVKFPPSARVLEVGSGSGAISRVLAQWPGVGEVVGVDPSPLLVSIARTRSGGVPHLSFEEADGRKLPFGGNTFDVVAFHTVLCHVPQPEQALAEAHRVLRPGGTVVIYDGDYATISVALGPGDPLQACVEAFKPAFIHDCWLLRRLPSLVQEAGFEWLGSRSYGYAPLGQPDYLLSLIDRGADTLIGQGQIGAELGAALKAEARDRVVEGRFFGFIAYGSVRGRKRR
jgi:SAM-dependent methyltransferase